MKLKKILIPFYLILSTLYLFSCGPNEPGDPPELVPIPGYQHDIPWPSLADSPWPINRGNPQATGRSKFIGPTQGIISGIYEVSEDVYSSAVLNSDHILFFNSYLGTHAIDAEGNEKWFVRNNLWKNKSVPILTRDSVLVTLNLYGELNAYSFDGRKKWIFQSGEKTIVEMINIDLNGNIYFTDIPNNLYCINSLGELQWKHQLQDLSKSSNFSMSFSPDCKTLYLPGNSHSIYAFDIITKTIKWSFGNSEQEQAPLIDNQNNIYLHAISDSYNNSKPALFSVNKDGDVNWFYPHNSRYLIGPFSEPTINKWGDIYFGYDTLYCVDYKGRLNWKYNLDNHITVPLVNDADGNIYFIKSKRFAEGVICLSRKGELLWEFLFPDGLSGGTGFESPVLGNGVMYLLSNNNNLIYKIE
jgi:outer membrane protein assembly factor BamB